jgi:alpha-tubulin suppressor-like RCC1 family protein
MGDGTTNSHNTPVLVGGGLRFRQVSAGFGTSCGVTIEYGTYCWGFNILGQLGDGTTQDRHSPVAVVGGHKFSQIETNFEHTCGLSYPDNKAYCWGSNREGQLGIGTNDFDAHSTPLVVSGGLTFRRLTAGYDHTCGVTTDSRAFCWGYGKNGQRGDGSVTERIRTPRAVLGGHLFTRVSAAVFHTCGVTPSNQAWCWGLNVDGELGAGTTIFTRLTPHLVVGGLMLNQVSAGAFHTCGKTTGSLGYCWGNNVSGELGNGTNAGARRRLR